MWNSETKNDLSIPIVYLEEDSALAGTTIKGDKCAHVSQVLYSQVVTNVTWIWVQLLVSGTSAGVRFGFFCGVGGGGWGDKANTTWNPIQLQGFWLNEAQQLFFTFATYGPLGGPSMGKILGADCSRGQGWQHFQLARTWTKNSNTPWEGTSTLHRRHLPCMSLAFVLLIFYIFWWVHDKHQRCRWNTRQGWLVQQSWVVTMHHTLSDREEDAHRNWFLVFTCVEHKSATTGI